MSKRLADAQLVGVEAGDGEVVDGGLGFCLGGPEVVVDPVAQVLGRVDPAVVSVEDLDFVGGDVVDFNRGGPVGHGRVVSGFQCWTQLGAGDADRAAIGAPLVPVAAYVSAGQDVVNSRGGLGHGSQVGVKAMASCLYILQYALPLSTGLSDNPKSVLDGPSDTIVSGTHGVCVSGTDQTTR